jgi:ferric enterobactin receptor
MNSQSFTRYVLLAFGVLVWGLLSSRAQSLPSISGEVRTVAGVPIEFATVTLHRAADSAVVKTEFSDGKGTFRFERAASGRYRVSAAQVGFGRYWSAAFDVAAESLVLPAATLQASAATTLKEVVVVGQKPLFERLADRTVVNVEGSTLAAGNSTLDVLARAPGVTVDANDNLALRGRQGLLVLIDGKRQPMSGPELADYLRSLPADQLKSIELITNPPAKYDAQGSAGIIAINLKKDQRLGTNGSANLSYGQGVYGRFTGSLTGNHRREKFNFFGSVSYTDRGAFGIRNTYRSYYQPQGDAQVLLRTADQRNRIEYSNRSLPWKAGLDYNLAKNTVLGAVVTGFMNPGVKPWGQGSNTSTFYDGAGQLTNQYRVSSRQEDNNPNLTANLNLRHSWAATPAGKRELTADVDYARYSSSRLQSQTIYPEMAGRDEATLSGSQTGELTIQAVKADYTQALSPQTTLEAGAKASRVYSDNDVRFENTVGGVTTTDLGRTNRFRYDELISAAYLNVTRTIAKLNVQAGLRGEQTHATGQQLVQDDNFRRDYYQLFPSAALKYTFSERQELALSLGRRIGRPSYRQLNPFRNVIDPTTSGKGNPNLRPQTSYNLELTHTYRQKFSSGLSYSLFQEPITDVAQPETDSTTVSQYVNLDRLHYLALTFTAPFTVGKWWNLNLNAELYYIHYQGTLAGTALRTGRPAFSASSTSAFSLGKGWSAELTGNYDSRQRVGFFIFEHYGQVGLGVQKALWDKQGTVKLAATDIFYTSPLYATSNYTNYQEKLFLRRDARVLTLSFSWRFGNDKLAPARRTGGAEDEKSRAQ